MTSSRFHIDAFMCHRQVSCFNSNLTGVLRPYILSIFVSNLDDDIDGVLIKFTHNLRKGGEAMILEVRVRIQDYVNRFVWY